MSEEMQNYEQKRGPGRTAERTDAEIVAAGEDLEGQGKRVSGYMIRASFGGKGRTDRYQKVWDDHLSARASAPTEATEAAPSVVLPPEMHSAVEAGHGQIGVTLESLALTLFRYATDSAATRVADADKRAADAESQRVEIEQAGEAAMNAMQDENDRLQSQLEESQRTAEAAVQHAQQQEGIAADRAGQLDAAKLENEAIRQQLSEMTSKFNVAHAEVGRLTRDASAMSEKLEDAQKESRRLNESLLGAERRATDAHAKAEERAKHVESLQGAVDGLHADLTNARASIAGAEAVAAERATRLASTEELLAKERAAAAEAAQKAMDDVRAHFIAANSANDRATQLEAQVAQLTAQLAKKSKDVGEAKH